MSGWNGDNLTSQSENMPWYEGFSVSIKRKKIRGFTLLDALNDVVTLPKRLVKKPLRYLSILKFFIPQSCVIDSYLPSLLLF